MHPSEGEKHIFEKGVLENAFRHKKNENYSIQLASFMQSVLSSKEIYKKMRCRMKLFLTDRIPDAKNAQVMDETQNSSVPKSGKIAIRTARSEQKGL